MATSPIPSQVTQTNYGFAPEVAPYAQNMLGQAAALTDTEMNPYMQYQGERVAQFSPLQNQSYENAALMQSQPQLQDATAMAGQAGLGALNTGYTYNPFQTKAFNSPGMAESYMSPYMQNVVKVQQDEAIRQKQIADQGLQAQATKSGAFGGSRDAIMRSEADRNLATQLGSIQATGLQNAYQQGMGQFNTEQGATQAAANLNAQQGQFGAGLGLQGLQTALTSANTLGTLGNQQYQQNMGVNALQNQYGLQQQAQVQQDLTNKYQDYLNYQNAPYKQLGFMSDIVRGAPLTQTGSSVYTAPPSTAQTVASLGLGAAGVSKLWGGANGGVAQGMAEGGMSDTAQDKAMIKKAFKQHDMQEHKGGKGTSLKLAKGGTFRASANGIATKGKTKGTMISMKHGGKTC